MKLKRAVILIGGPTATGKSKVAESLAESQGGEIISVDSMQVYRGMDIGTAKPSKEERERFKYHLIDVVDITEQFDAAKFSELALSTEREIRKRGKTVILCGGTGLYFQAYLEGLGTAPMRNETLRGQLEELSLTELIQELQERDPLTVGEIDLKNRRRVLRAVEVIRLTGKPFSRQRALWRMRKSGELDRSDGGSEEKFFFAFERPRQELNERIERRVDMMFEKGLITETEALLQQGLGANPTAMQAIGYRQVVEYLRNKRSLDETVSEVKRRTKQYAKRQMTWFRKQHGIYWINAAGLDETGPIISEITKKVHSAAKRSRCNG